MNRLLLVSIALIAPATASAQSTATYEYDVLGRLVVSTNATGPTNVRTAIEYDPAGNRKNYQVTGAANGDDSGSSAGVPATLRFVVVPLNGFTVIPIN